MSGLAAKASLAATLLAPVALDASLKHDPQASRFLDRPPSDHGFAPGLLTAIRMAPRP